MTIKKGLRKTIFLILCLLLTAQLISCEENTVKEEVVDQKGAGSKVSDEDESNDFVQTQSLFDRLSPHMYKVGKVFLYTALVAFICAILLYSSFAYVFVNHSDKLMAYAEKLEKKKKAEEEKKEADQKKKEKVE